MLPADDHRTRAADALTGRAAKCRSPIPLVFDLDERVEDHGATGLRKGGVFLQERLLHGARVLAVDAERLRRGCNGQESASTE